MTLLPAWMRRRSDLYSTSADIIVYRDGPYAVAVDTRTKQVIARDTDHVKVWQQAVDNVPEYGAVAGSGEFEFTDSLFIKKPIKICGGYIKRSTSVGSSPGPALLVIGNTSSSDPIVDGPIIIEGMILDGNGREFNSLYDQPYGESAGAPGGRVGIYVKRARHVIIRNNIVMDHQRTAINLITVSNTSGVIDHENIVISGNIILNWGDDGVTIESSRRVIINNNIFVGANTNGDSGVSGSGISLNYLTIRDVVIQGNVIDGMVPDGFPYAGSYGRLGIRSGNADVTGVRISNNTSRNWYIGIGPVSADIINNTIHDVDIGISLAYGSDRVVAYNKILNFRTEGIHMDGSSSSITQRNIVINNYLDPGTNTPNYGIKCSSYAEYNIILNNIVKGTYNYDKYSIWVNYNICDGFVWNSNQLSALDLSGFPDMIPMAKFLYYDGTYYYTVYVDLINKAIRKVQLS